MAKLRFILVFEIFTAFYFAMCERVPVYLDNSQDNCIGTIKKTRSAQDWTEYANITDCYLCLKTCTQKHGRAKTAAYAPEHGCFCSRLSYGKLHLAQNNTGCISDDISTTSLLKVYNMSGFTLRLEFERYIEQNLVFKVDIEALLYYNDTIINDSRKLGGILPTGTCEVITKQDHTTTRTSCFDVFRFKLLGENQICLQTGNTSSICDYVIVLAPVSIANIEVHVKSNGTLLQSKITGTVYELSFSLDDKLVETLNVIDQYNKKKVFEICEINWKLWPRAVMLDGDRKLVVRASNPLNASGVIEEKLFNYFDEIKLVKSYFFDVIRDEIEITIEAEGGMTTKLDGLNYEWSEYMNSGCVNVTFQEHVTTVPKVKVKSPSFDARLIWDRQPCRIQFTPMSKNGYRYPELILTELFRGFNPGELDAYAIVSTTEYFLRGKEATFEVKKSKWSQTSSSYIWKVNGKNLSGDPTFKHTFNETGSYTISVFDGLFWGPASKNISVLEVLTKMRIVVTSFRYFGKPISVRAVVNCYENVVYHWDFGDGTQTNTSSNVVEHQYGKPGMYNLHVVANNGISEIEANKTVNETEMCPDGEFQTSFEDGKEVKQFRSRSIHLEVSKKKLFCFEPVNITFKWTIFRWTDESNEWLDFDKSNKSTDSIYIPSNELDYGKYRFNVTLNVSGSSVSHSESFSTVINVTESPVFALIRGGSKRYVIENSTFFLDATPSFDPENPNAELRFQWSLPDGIKNPPDTTDAVIELNSAELNGFGEFKVRVSFGKRANEASQHITIIHSKEIKTNMVLDCPSCDIKQLNPSKATRIMEKCTSGYCSSNSKRNLWNLYELRLNYGKAKLEEIQCTASDQTSLPLLNNRTSTSPVSYKFHECTHEHALVKRSTRNNPNEVEAQLSFKRKNPHSKLLDIKKNYFPGNRRFIIRRVVESVALILAERVFHVKDMPKDYSCAIHPTEGIELLQDFEIKCNVDKSAHLMYKVLYKRENADSTSTISNIFFQRKVPQFKFHLPSGYKDKNYVIISLESKDGVAREYCSIKMVVKPLVADFNATNNVEKYLYGRSVAVKNRFSEHPYAYHGQTLYNITLISDVLNRQPSATDSSLLHLRTQIREMLLNILTRIMVSSEIYRSDSSQYVSRQFASSLESCARVTEELTNSSSVAVVDILYNFMRRKRNHNERSLELDNDFQENILTVVNSIKTKTNSKEDELKLLESLNYLFEDSLRTKFVRTPVEIINFTKNAFKASITKFSPYRSDSIVFNWGETRVVITTTGDEDSKKYYDCDLFGCGLQGLTMDIDPFRDNDTYQTVSSLTKLKTQNCKQVTNINCGAKITAVKMVFPIRFSNNTLQSTIYRLSSGENHIFTLERTVDTLLNMELVPIGSLSNKLRLRVRIRCAEVKYQVKEEFSFSFHMERRQLFFSPANFRKECKVLNVMVDIQWAVEPTKYESQQTVVMYNLHMRSLNCLTKEHKNDQWSENPCKCEITYINSTVPLLNCSTEQLQGPEYSYVVVAKTLQSSLKEIVVDREDNKIVNRVMLVLSLCYAAVVLVLFVRERQHYKNSSAILLERCDPSHTHKYKITVYTGHCCGADTTAKVAVVLYGENNSSYPVELFTKNRALFQRNSRDVFVVSVRENLGSLNCIHLWHDNSGSSPSWFVDKIIIKDLSANEKWMFKCSRWLAVDKNDGMLDCKIKPSKFKHNFTFKEFQLALGENLMDFHIWLSLIRMPMYSLFTRAERLTCCMALLFGYLYFNAYFCYNYKEFIVDRVSVFNPTMSQFKVGVFATLTCLPVYLFFAVMFRYTQSFIWLQPAKSGKVAPTSMRKPSNINEPCAVEKCGKVLPKIDHSSEEYRRRKQLELAALLVKSMGDEDDPASDQEIMCSDEDSSTETTGIAPTNSSHSPVTMSKNQKVIDHELASDSSRSSLSFTRSYSFRFPMCINVLMWIGCIVTFFLSSQFTVEYVSRLDDVTLRCYKQSVFWSLFISMFISQPFQALFVTGIQVMRKFFHSTIIDEPGQEIGEDDVPDDSMFASFTEKNFEDPLYRKLFCIKYLKPLSKKAVTRARCRLHKQNTTVIVLRDVLMYCLLLVFLYLLNPFWNQKSIFLQNNGLKTFFNRQVNTTSVLTWWSSSPQMFLDTLTFDNKTLTMRAFQNKDLVIGNPEVTMIFKYCQVNNTYQINGSLANTAKRDCTKEFEEKVLGFSESQKKNWLGLTNSVNDIFNKYVKDITLKFVIYLPQSDVFSVVKVSSHVMSPSAHVQSDVAITTVGFHVDRSMTLSFQTICQLLFAFVPMLLFIRQSYSSTSNNKGSVLGVSIELMLVILSLLSVILMWIWIKYQYFTLGVLLIHQYEANIVDDLETVYKHQEAFKCSIAFMLFFVSIKVCHVIGVDKLLNCQVEIFISVISYVLLPLFALLIVFVGFAHMGVLLFGDHLKMYETFVEAFSQVVVYLRRTGAENLVADTPYQQMLLAFYVVAFCVCMIFFSNLVKAAFCQARINFLLAVKRKRRIPIKVYFFRKVRRVFSLIRSYLEEPKDEDDTLKRVPMSYIFKELDEQLNDLEFRLTHLTCKANMPTKAVMDRGSSSDCTDVEYVYKGENGRPSYSSFRRDLASNKSSPFELPTQENMADPNLGCTSKQSSDSGSMTTHADTAISNATKKRRPFQRTMRAFPTPMNETLKSSGYPHVLLDPWLAESDFAKTEKTTTDEKLCLVDCEKEKEDIVMDEMSAKEPKGNFAKKNRGGLKLPQAIVNDYTNNACEGDVEDFYGYLTAKRSNVCLNAFEDESTPTASDNEDEADISLAKQCEAEVIVHKARSKLDSTSENEQHAFCQRPFQQPALPVNLNQFVSRSSEI